MKKTLLIATVLALGVSACANRETIPTKTDAEMEVEDFNAFYERSMRHTMTHLIILRDSHTGEERARVERTISRTCVRYVELGMMESVNDPTDIFVKNCPTSAG
ncbi:MAG: hypothetical protein V4682_01840 [Patescibacteria group bacterium]